MYLDALLQLSAAQSLSGAGTVVSTNTVDLGNSTVKRQIGDGEPMCVLFNVNVAADFTTGDETYAFQVIQSAAAALTSPSILGQLAFIATTSVISSALVAGYLAIVPIPPGFPTQRYLGAQYVLGGTTPIITVSAIVMPLHLATVKQTIYQKGYTIS